MQLSDIYAIASIYFIKGIADAQRICNPYLVEMVIDSSRLTLIGDNDKIQLTCDNYVKFILSDLSRHELCALRGLIMFYNDKKFIKELCFLLDFLYKKGCSMAGKYEGKNMNNKLSCISHTANIFFTPEGNLSDYAWHDLLRKYLVKLHFEYKRFSSDELDHYMVNEMLNIKKIEESKQKNAAREQFILSGEDVPGK